MNVRVATNVVDLRICQAESLDQKLKPSNDSRNMNVRIQAPPIPAEEPRAPSISQLQFIFLATVV
jgi:hypothetical protein